MDSDADLDDYISVGRFTPCIVCGRKMLAKQRCSRCYYYWRKHGVDRPWGDNDGRRRYASKDERREHWNAVYRTGVGRGNHGNHSRGATHHFWKGGRTVKADGYINIRVEKGHHLANRSGYALEHRLIAERKIGRRLLPEEIVHHINGDKQDNREDNLEITTQAEHARLHGNARDGETGRFVAEASRAA